MPKSPSTEPKSAILRLGNALRALRRSQGFTQEELVHRSGISVTSLRDYEQGRASPTWQTLTQIADGLGISMAELGQAYDLSSAGRQEPKVGRPPGKRSAPRR